MKSEGNHQETFSQWMSDYQKLIFKVVCAYERRPSDQEDLFQEIALQVWKSVPKFRGDAAESTWIYRIALNTAMTWSRKQRTQAMRKRSLEETVPLLQPSPGSPNPRLNWLYDQIHRLNPVDRSLILLVLDGYSYREMVAILGITESNVGVRINRIKKQFIQQLATGEQP